MTGTHEDWDRPEAVKASSNRTFGLVFTAFWALVAFLPLVRDHKPRWWAAALSGLFLVVALAAPGVLAPLNRVWTALGILLHSVTNPILLGILFYLVFTPFGWLLRLTGQGFSSPEAAEGCKELLDRAATAGARAAEHVKPVLGATLSILVELWSYMRARKKLWMMPLLIMVFLLGAMLILAKSSAIAPFIYTLF